MIIPQVDEFIPWETDEIVPEKKLKKKKKKKSKKTKSVETTKPEKLDEKPILKEKKKKKKKSKLLKVEPEVKIAAAVTAVEKFAGVVAPIEEVEEEAAAA